MQKSKLIYTNTLPSQKTLTFHNVIILIKLVFNKDKNNCYYNLFLEKGFDELSNDDNIYVLYT